MMNINILLSAYNGEKYLREQVDSIIQQESVDVGLIIRDDGSQDNTKNLLDEIVSNHPMIVVLKESNVGFIRSFSTLVSYAHDNSNSDFYAFSDQDDIWCLAKLKTAIDALSSFDQSKPMLWCCNSTIINADGEEQYLLRPYELHFNRGNSIYSCKIQGCAMVFNRVALELFAKYPPVSACHDTWMFYICNFFGTVIYDKTPLIKYRVHGNNAIGSSASTGIIETWRNRLRNWHTNKHVYFINAAREFRDAFHEDLSAADINLLNTFIGYKQSVIKKMRMINTKEFGSAIHSLKSELLFVYHVFTNQI